MKNYFINIKESFIKNKDIIIKFLICLLISFISITICSKNSFLYSFNPWVDNNWYITMGNGFKKGLIPYRDLYEQKGFLVYFTMLIICSIFRSPYIGLYIFEIMIMTAFCLIASTLINRFVKSKFTLLYTLMLAVLITCTDSFEYGGGSIEEWCLPIFAYCLLKFVDYFYFKKDYNYKTCITFGILFSLLFWLKFSLVIVMIIPLVLWFVDKLIKKEKDVWLKTLTIFSIFLIFSSIIVLYYYFNNGLKDLFTVYFYNNIFLYNSKLNIVQRFSEFMYKNIILMILSFWGYNWFILTKKNIKFDILLSLYFFGLLLFLLDKGYYIYYIMPFFTFSILGFIAIDELISIYNLFNFKTFNKSFKYICLTLSILIFCFGVNYSKLLFTEKDKYAPIQVAKYFEENNIKDFTFLQYKILDYGFYNTLNISPNTYFFAWQNFSKNQYSYMYDQTESYIKDKKCEYVITTTSNYNNDKLIFGDNYVILKDFYDSHLNTTFVLLKLV